MRVAAVLACVRLIGTSIAGLPVKTLVRNEDDSKQPDRDHPAYRLVHRRANPWTAAGELRRQLTFDALLHGYGAAIAQRDLNGRVIELHRVDPSRTPVTVEINEQTLEPSYIVNRRRYAWQDVLLISNPAGAAIISLVKEAIGSAIVFEQHISKFFRTGKPNSIILSTETVPTEVQTNIYKMLRQSADTGLPAFIDRANEYVSLAISSTDAQFIENRQFAVTEIARAFGVPPTFLGILDQATYRNAEELNLQFVRFCLDPWIKVWEAAYERVLLTEDELDTVNIEFNVDGLLRADSASRAEFIAKMRAAGVMTANEARSLENLPARPEGNVLSNPYTTSGTPQPPASEETNNE